MKKGGKQFRMLGLDALPSAAKAWLGAQGVSYQRVGSANTLLKRIRDDACDLALVPFHDLEGLRQLKDASRPDEYLPVVVQEADGILRAKALLNGADAAISMADPPESWCAQLFALLRIRAKSLEVQAAKRELELLSVTDDLTGLYNKRWLLGRLQEELSRAERYKDGFALVLFDLDHFKRINDAHGHLFGDEVLRAFADLLRQTFRGVDKIARYGGEEFAVILPETCLEGGRDAAERFRRSVENSIFAGVAVTTSAGVAAYPPCETSGYQDLLRRADQALYRAKREGRNQVAVCNPAAEVVAAGTYTPKLAFPR